MPILLEKVNPLILSFRGVFSAFPLAGSTPNERLPDLQPIGDFDVEQFSEFVDSTEKCRSSLKHPRLPGQLYTRLGKQPLDAIEKPKLNFAAHLQDPRYRSNAWQQKHANPPGFQSIFLWVS